MRHKKPNGRVGILWTDIYLLAKNKYSRCDGFWLELLSAPSGLSHPNPTCFIPFQRIHVIHHLAIPGDLFVLLCPAFPVKGCNKFYVLGNNCGFNFTSFPVFPEIILFKKIDFEYFPKNRRHFVNLEPF